jgi:hypothetical protein
MTRKVQFSAGRSDSGSEDSLSPFLNSLDARPRERAASGNRWGPNRITSNPTTMIMGHRPGMCGIALLPAVPAAVRPSGDYPEFRHSLIRVYRREGVPSSFDWRHFTPETCRAPRSGTGSGAPIVEPVKAGCCTASAANVPASDPIALNPTAQNRRSNNQDCGTSASPGDPGPFLSSRATGLLTRA